MIELPGYHPLVNNEIYASISSSDGFKKLIMFKRFIQPSEDRVVEYLQDNFKNLRNYDENSPGNWSGLEKAIITLPKDFRINVAINNPETINFLRKYTSAGQESDFLNMVYGFLPEPLLNLCSIIPERDFYRKTISRANPNVVGYGKVLDFELPYALVGDRNKLVNLLRQMCPNIENRVLVIFKDFLDVVHAGISRKEDFEKIPLDQSYAENIVDLALQPLNILHKVINKKRREEKLIKVVKTHQDIQRSFTGKDPKKYN